MKNIFDKLVWRIAKPHETTKRVTHIKSHWKCRHIYPKRNSTGPPEIVRTCIVETRTIDVVSAEVFGQDPLDQLGRKSGRCVAKTIPNHDI